MQAAAGAPWDYLGAHLDNRLAGSRGRGSAELFWRSCGAARRSLPAELGACADFHFEPFWVPAAGDLRSSLPRAKLPDATGGKRSFILWQGGHSHHGFCPIALWKRFVPLLSGWLFFSFFLVHLIFLAVNFWMM